VSLSLGTHRYRIWSDAHAPTRVEVTLSLDRRVVTETVALRPAEAVRIAEIRRGGAGWVAGLRDGDVIRAVNGNPTASVAALHAALAGTPLPVAIEYERGAEKRTTTLTANRIGAEVENILLGR
jgi:S1-C subfamily serine protease